MVNNLKLNKSKTMEMVIYQNARAKSNGTPIPLLPEIERVDGMKILGVYYDSNLCMKSHIDTACQRASQCIYAIKLLRNHGLSLQSIYAVCNATLVSYLTYAIPAWWSFSSAAEQHKLQAVLNRAIKWGLYSKESPSVEQICNKRSCKLFNSLLTNPDHVLHQYLPPEKVHGYDMRPRAHNRELPKKSKIA
jgi:hypothetical protein